MKNNIHLLPIISAVLTIVSALIGLFYSSSGNLITVENIYGQSIPLYGDGVYAYNSLLKVGATKGTDLIMLGVAILLLIVIIFFQSKSYAKHLQAGLLSALLYNSACLTLGISFNVLFLLYLVQFSTAVFAFVLLVYELLHHDCFQTPIYHQKLKGTAIFLFVAGCSVLIWLSLIIPAILSGTPSFVEIYTTEPTFVIDLGLIFPLCLMSGIGLFKKQKSAYLWASILMTLVTIVGCCVISQTVFQLKLGIVITMGQLIGMVGSFVILGGIAIFLNYRLLKYAKALI